MSNFSQPVKQKLSTWLDDAGLLLGLPRLEDESLIDYRSRLIDNAKNRGSSINEGLNYSLARNNGLRRNHIFTISCSEELVSPLIEVTSKYLRFYNDDEVLDELDLYDNTMGDIYTYINDNISLYTIDYYNDDFEDERAIKLLYGKNLKHQPLFKLGPSKLNTLEVTYVQNIFFSSDRHRVSRNSIEEIVNPEDFYLDKLRGLIYTGTNTNDVVTFDYYEIPFKLWRSPISYYPLSDQDINSIIKDTLFMDEGETRVIINSVGAKLINELLSVHPLTLGE